MMLVSQWLMEFVTSVHLKQIQWDWLIQVNAFVKIGEQFGFQRKELASAIVNIKC